MRVIALYFASETEYSIEHSFPEQGLKVISYFTRKPKPAQTWEAETGEVLEDVPF